MNTLSIEDDRRIPVTLLTGFLGAGKTTLLNHVVRQPEMERCALLINEFGEVGIDHHLVERVDETLMILDSGCLCCSVQGDLVKALRDLADRASKRQIPPVTRVLIETTGLADPAPVIYTLMQDPFVAARYRCDGVVTVVDATHAVRQVADHGEALRQIAMADRLLISKCDLADATSRRSLEATLAAAGQMQLYTSGALHNAGNIRAASVLARGDTLAVSGGTLQADTLSVNTQDVQLSGGAVVAGRATVDATRYTQAQSAQFYSQGDLALRAGSLSNAGDIQSGARTTVTVAQTLGNTGTLAAAGDLGITADSISSSGTLAAGLNADGSLKAFAAEGAKLNVTTTGDLTATGKTMAAGAITLTGQALNLGGSRTSGQLPSGLAYQRAKAADWSQSWITATDGAVLRAILDRLGKLKPRLSALGVEARFSGAFGLFRRQAGALLVAGGTSFNPFVFRHFVSPCSKVGAGGTAVPNPSAKPACAESRADRLGHRPVRFFSKSIIFLVCSILKKLCCGVA